MPKLPGGGTLVSSGLVNVRASGKKKRRIRWEAVTVSCEKSNALPLGALQQWPVSWLTDARVVLFDSDKGNPPGQLVVLIDDSGADDLLEANALAIHFEDVSFGERE